MAEEVSRVTLKSLYIRVMEGTENALTRPFVANVTGDVVSQYERQISETDSYQLGRLANRFTTYSTAPGSDIIIPEGWNTSRAIFYAEVRVETSLNTQVFHLQGYTDYAGVRSGIRSTGRRDLLDQEMVFYVNSINKSVLQTQVRRDRRSGRGIEAPAIIRTGSSLFMYDHGFKSASKDRAGRRNESHLTGITARTVLSSLDLDGPREEDWVNTQNSFRNNVVNTSTRLKKVPTVVSAGSVLAGRMISQVSEAYVRSLDSLPAGMVMETPSAAAINALTETDEWKQGIFLDLLMSANNYSRNKGSFAWKDLLKVCPDADDVVKVYEPEKMRSFSDNSNLYGSSAEALAATKIFSEVPTLLMEKFLSAVKFKASVVNGRDVVSITSFLFLSENVSQARVLENLIADLEDNIFYSVSGPNRLFYEIDGYISVLGKSVLTISIEGGHNRTYEHFTACSGLTAPCITDDESDLYTMCRAVTSLVEAAREITDEKDFKRMSRSVGREVDEDDVDMPDYPDSDVRGRNRDLAKTDGLDEFV